MDVDVAVKQGQGVGSEELGDLLVGYLAQLGVDFVFGIPGGAIEPLVNALARSERQGGPRCVTSRHETGAAFMAEGYHTASGKLAVCFATTGPGATNLITGVASAFANQVPMLVITAQTPLETFGRGAFQESSCTGINTLSMFEAITRYNSLVSHPDQFEAKFAAAVLRAFEYPRGPVHLSVPMDVMRAQGARARRFSQLSRHLREPDMVDESALVELRQLLTASRSPVLVIGNRAAEAMPGILALAEARQIPMVVTPNGNGLVKFEHPLYRGVIGFAGHASALRALRDSRVDLVIAIGTSLGEWASNGWDELSLLNDRLVHVEASTYHFVASPMARLHVAGALPKVVAELLASEPARAGTLKPVADQGAGAPCQVVLEDPAGYRSDQSPILPQRLMALLPELFPPDTRYLADTGNSFAWAIHYLHPSPPSGVHDAHLRGGLFRTCLEFSSMGWAIGSAVGTALALPDTAVVCITGDGSYLMSGQEITVALTENLSVFFVILNDAGYGMVKHGQRQTGAEPLGYALPPVDFAAMARAMGVDGYVIESVEDLRALDITALCRQRRPILLDVRIDPEAKPPLAVRTNTLKGGRP